METLLPGGIARRMPATRDPRFPSDIPNFMNKHLTTLWMTALSLGTSLVSPAAQNPSAAAQSVNALGLDLLAKGTETKANALLSPYSIQSALAMTYAGAAGDTRAQMAKALHFPADEPALHQSFAGLQKALEATPISPPSGPATGSFNGIHRESNFLAKVTIQAI